MPLFSRRRQNQECHCLSGRDVIYAEPGMTVQTEFGRRPLSTGSPVRIRDTQFGLLVETPDGTTGTLLDKKGLSATDPRPWDLGF